MRPHYLAIKLNNKIIGHGEGITFDLFLVNEDVLNGNYTLEVNLVSDSDTIEKKLMKVWVSGGDLHGELLAESLEFHLPDDQTAGYLGLEAKLHANGEIVTTGQEQVYKLPQNTMSSGLKILYEGDKKAIHTCLDEHGIDLIPFAPHTSESNLLVTTMIEDPEKMEKILKWVSSGHQLVVVENTIPWATFLAKKGTIKLKGVIRNDTEWTAGGLFNLAHPVFDGLPSMGVMGWEYQELACDCTGRYSLMMEGEKAIVGALDNDQHQFGTAMGEIKYGKGTILFSTLNLEKSLQLDNNASKMGESLLLNMVAHYSRQQL